MARPGVLSHAAWIAACATAVALGGASAPAGATVFHTQIEALALAFPDADEVRSKTLILRAEETERIQKLSRGELPTRVIKIHSGWKNGQLEGYAYIDIHTVRTQPEAFMVVLAPDGSVRSLRVLAFHEPLDYLPTDRWFEQFDGKPVGEPLRVGRDIHGIMGATLSAQAVSASVRRVQAFYKVLLEPEAVASHDGKMPPPGAPAAIDGEETESSTARAAATTGAVSAAGRAAAVGSSAVE